MRLISPEEDKLLEGISLLKEEIRNIENDIMVCESGLKGNVRRKSSEFTNFLFFFVISLALFMVFLGYLICGMSLGMFTSFAMFFGAGGAGFFVIAIWIYTFILYVRFRATSSKSALWKKIASLLKLDSIASEDSDIKIALRNMKHTLIAKKNKLEEMNMEYEDLRDSLDEEYESKGIQTNKSDINDMNVNKDRNSLDSITNYQIQFDWREQNKTLKGELNQLIVNYNLYRSQKDELEEKIQELEVVVNEMTHSRRSMNIFCYLVFFIAACVFLGATMMHSFVFQLIMSAILIAIFGLIIMIIVNVLTLPFVKDSALADSIGRTFNTARPMKEINEYLAQIKELDKLMVDTDEQIEIAKRDYEASREKSELPYRY